MAGTSCRVTDQLQLMHITQPETPGVPEVTAAWCCDDALQLINERPQNVVLLSLLLVLYSTYHSKSFQSSFRRFGKELTRPCKSNETIKTD